MDSRFWGFVESWDAIMRTPGVHYWSIDAESADLTAAMLTFVTRVGGSADTNFTYRNATRWSRSCIRGTETFAPGLRKRRKIPLAGCKHPSLFTLESEKLFPE